ncbi:nuclear transport factor 2 family protein [Sphingobium phenoxybenzoativorans]|uniref:nuclear transport factor 2 family protein n=1 Tax=Sphingobium phenoxybenzoativorans TaxID=1592790 RepID=UPI0008725338|nr:nuclear transport factor 2 family protein [Sphingobium phenoxybenzoativorans]
MDKALENRLTRLEDIEIIREQLERYGHALDWHDGDLLDSVIFDDADVDYGIFKLDGRGAKDRLMEIEAAFPRRWHFTASPTIAFLDAFTAETVSYQIAISSTEADPGNGLTQYFGWYLDRFEKRDGHWGIAARKHVLLGFGDIAEQPLPEIMQGLNRLTNASPAHPDYRKPGQSRIAMSQQ